MIYFPKVFRSKALLLTACHSFDTLSKSNALLHPESIAQVIEQNRSVLEIIEKAEIISPIGVSRHQINTYQTIINEFYTNHTSIYSICEQLAISRTSFFRYKKIAEKSIDSNLSALLKKKIGIMEIDKSSTIKSTFLSDKWYEQDGLASSGSIYSTFKAFTRRHRFFLETALEEYETMIISPKNHQLFEVLSSFFFSCTSYNAFLAMIRAHNSKSLSNQIGDSVLNRFLEDIGVLIYGIDFAIYDCGITTAAPAKLPKSPTKGI